MNCRVGCMLLAILFALMFVFGGMFCRVVVPFSPDPAEHRPAVEPQAGILELHGVLDVIHRQ